MESGGAGVHRAWAAHPPDHRPLPLRCSNLERHRRPLHSALACWSTHRPQGSPLWKPAPTASLMNCDVMEPSSPTTARFPPSSTLVLEVRAQLGMRGTRRQAKVVEGGLVFKIGVGCWGWGCSGDAPNTDLKWLHPCWAPSSLSLSVQWLHVRCPCQELAWSPNTLRPDWACPFLFLELSIQPSLNAILIPPHLRSPAGTATLTPSSQGKSEALFADEGLPQPGRLVCCHSP